MKLLIVDIGWGIDRKSGERLENEVARVELPLEKEGDLPPVGPARKVFRIEELKENEAKIFLSQKQGTVVLKAGQSYTYRPMSLDGGHIYELTLEKNISKSLQIKAVSEFEGKIREAEATVPFVSGRYDLPEEYPFSLSTYVGPDDGYALDWVNVDVEKNLLTFGHMEMVKLVDGRAEKVIKRRSGETITISFELK